MDVETVDFTNLDALPFGVIVVDHAGVIIEYNAAEQRFARRTREATVGRNFFTQVAPCTSVRAFHGRFLSFVDGQHRLGERFWFRFPFPWGVALVMIQFARMPDMDRVAIVIEARGEE